VHARRRTHTCTHTHMYTPHILCPHVRKLHSYTYLHHITCMHTHTHTCIHAYTSHTHHAHAHTHTYIHKRHTHVTHTYIHKRHTHTCPHTCPHTRTHTRTHTYKHTRPTHIHTHTHTRTHTHTHRCWAGVKTPKPCVHCAGTWQKHTAPRCLPKTLLLLLGSGVRFFIGCVYMCVMVAPVKKTPYQSHLALHPIQSPPFLTEC